MTIVVDNKEDKETRKETLSEKAEVKATPFNLLEYLKEVRVEFSKISWPSKAQVTREFFSVILLVAVLTGIIFIIDKIFGAVSNFFTGNLFS